MTAASNTRECFKECIGKRVRGVLFDALPVSRADLSGGNKTLIFEDGTGLTVASNGSFWIDSAPEIARAVECRKRQLEDYCDEIGEVLAAAGNPPKRKRR